MCASTAHTQAGVHALAPAPVPTLPPPTSFDPTCSTPATPGLQNYLDALPPGSVFTSSTTACYLVPNGIRLTRPVTLVGGTFYDPSTTRPNLGWPFIAMQPIILIKDTSAVTLQGVSVLGANVGGGYHAPLVGEAGVKIESSLGVTLTDVSSRDTFGDGLELVADLTNHIKMPVTGLTVEGFTTVTAGRQGVTIAEVADSTLDHVTVVDPADAGIDFESDLPGIGSGNVTVSNCTDDAGFNIVEFLDGPITIADCTGFHHVTLRSPQSNLPVSFVGGTLDCKRHDPQPCIHQTDGTLSFTGTTIDRMAGTIGITEPVWTVEGAASLRFVRSHIAVPFGTVALPATVAFVR